MCIIGVGWQRWTYGNELRGKAMGESGPWMQEVPPGGWGSKQGKSPPPLTPCFFLCGHLEAKIHVQKSRVSWHVRKKSTHVSCFWIFRSSNEQDSYTFLRETWHDLCWSFPPTRVIQYKVCLISLRIGRWFSPAISTPAISTSREGNGMM